MSGATPSTATGPRPLSPGVAAGLVFFASAAVLVLEILAGRLLAPYVGVTLETFTGIIGVVLAGISLGAWLGGRAADRENPRALLGPLLVTGGILALLSPTLVDLLGPRLGGSRNLAIVILAAVGFFLPAAVLSAVTPAVVKLQLGTLDETGTVVGRLSAVGTAGAIFGTFVTGFVLIVALPTRTVILVVGAALVIAGLALWRAKTAALPPAAVLLVAAAAGLITGFGSGPCEIETTYFCARVEVDPARPTGRILFLDTLRHSYVDLADPTFLRFRYARDIADVIATLPDGPLDALYVGGGGFTFPRYLAAVRPGSTATVMELDPRLVDIAEDELGLDTSDPALEILIGDARLSLLRVTPPPGGFDLTLGDAFGGPSVPWHLTTREFLGEIHDVMTAEGVYTMNLIDHPPARFARAQARTLAAVWDHVILIAPPPYLQGEAGGNFVLAASDRPFDIAAIQARLDARGAAEVVVAGAALAEWIGDAPLLRDDYAPVDQLMTRL